MQLAESHLHRRDRVVLQQADFNVPAALFQSGTHRPKLLLVERDLLQIGEHHVIVLCPLADERFVQDDGHFSHKASNFRVQTGKQSSKERITNYACDNAKHSTQCSRKPSQRFNSPEPTVAIQAKAILAFSPSNRHPIAPRFQTLTQVLVELVHGPDPIQDFRDVSHFPREEELVQDVVHPLEVKHEIQLAHVAEIRIQNLNEEVN